MPLWAVILCFMWAIWCVVRAVRLERLDYATDTPIFPPDDRVCEEPPPTLKTGWRFTMGTGKRATVIEYEGMNESAALKQFMRDNHDYRKITVSEAM